MTTKKTGTETRKRTTTRISPRGLALEVSPHVYNPHVYSRFFSRICKTSIINQSEKFHILTDAPFRPRIAPIITVDSVIVALYVVNLTSVYVLNLRRPQCRLSRLPFDAVGTTNAGYRI